MSESVISTDEYGRTRKQIGARPQHQGFKSPNREEGQRDTALYGRMLAASSITTTGNTPSRVSAMQGMQQTHGNRAVQRVLTHRASNQARALPVQREVCAASGHSDPAVAAWYGGECEDELGRRHVSSAAGNYAVVPGAPGHRRAFVPTSRNELTEAEHLRITNAWDRLDTRMYVNGRGSTPEENQRLQQRFRNMLREDMQDSPTLRNVVSNIGLGDQNPFAVNVGEHQHDVFGDSFETRDVDLADLDAFGTRRVQNRHRDQVSRGEVITHFLTERYHDVTHPVSQQAVPAGANAAQARAIGEQNYRTRFNPSHAEAIRAQNEYRAERGQSRLLSSTMTDPDRFTGQSTATFRMQGGSRQEVTVDENSDIIDSRMVRAVPASTRIAARPQQHPTQTSAPTMDYATAAALARRDLTNLESEY